MYVPSKHTRNKIQTLHNTYNSTQPLFSSQHQTEWWSWNFKTFQQTHCGCCFLRLYWFIWCEWQWFLHTTAVDKHWWCWWWGERTLTVSQCLEIKKEADLKQCSCMCETACCVRTLQRSEWECKLCLLHYLYCRSLQVEWERILDHIR